MEGKPNTTSSLARSSATFSKREKEKKRLQKQKEKAVRKEEHQGKIDFFDTSKGFGFIRENGSQERYFVHVSGMMEEVGEGDKVIFELERGPKGMNAVKVRKG